MDRVEQLHLKLEQLQPVVRDCGGVGSMERSSSYGERTHQQDHERRPAQQLPSQSLRMRSPSPSRASRMACFRCGEMGHLRRDCSRSPSPSHHKDLTLQSNPDIFRGPLTTEDQPPPP